MESARLIEKGIPAVSEKFVTGLNQCLLKADSLQRDGNETNAIDAFGIPFQMVEEPMPSVKLAGGFDVTIRTMFKEQYCQTRYGKIENASYPISPFMRMELQAALEWISNAEQKNKNWMNIDRNEILFVYPSRMPQIQIAFVSAFGSPEDQSESFIERTEKFIQELRKSNLPKFPFGISKELDPLESSEVLNRFWKQNGEVATDRFKPIPHYHGLELLMEPALPITADLHILWGKIVTLGPFLGTLCAKRNFDHSIWKRVREILSMLGLFLYRENIRKEEYMENTPYLYGQLLKTADALHMLYCKVVRDGDFPQQFVGSSLFQNASEMPARTLTLFSQRMMPYYAWAKSYQCKGINEPEKESWRARWLYSQYESVE